MKPFIILILLISCDGVLQFKIHTVHNNSFKTRILNNFELINNKFEPLQNVNIKVHVYSDNGKPSDIEIIEVVSDSTGVVEIFTTTAGGEQLGFLIIQGEIKSDTLKFYHSGFHPECDLVININK